MNYSRVLYEPRERATPSQYTPSQNGSSRDGSFRLPYFIRQWRRAPSLIYLSAHDRWSAEHARPCFLYRQYRWETASTAFFPMIYEQSIESIESIHEILQIATERPKPRSSLRCHRKLHVYEGGENVSRASCTQRG